MSDYEMDLDNSLWAKYDMFLAELECMERDYDTSDYYFGMYFEEEESYED